MRPLIEKLKELEAKATKGPWQDLSVAGMTPRIKQGDRYWDNPNDVPGIVALRNSLPEIIQLLERAEREREAAEAFEKEVEAIGCTLLEVQVRHDQRRRDEFVVKKFQALERFKAQKWDIRDSYRESKG